jgi:hypothetical protein
MFRFMIAFTLFFTHGWGTFPKCRPRFTYNFILGTLLFWERPYLQALPYPMLFPLPIKEDKRKKRVIGLY